MFILLFINIVNASNCIKCVSLSNEKYKIQPGLINLHSNKCSQELHYYPFVVDLDRYIGRCSTYKDWYNKGCVPNKTEDLNTHVFNMITWKQESKALTKDSCCKCKCKFGVR